MSRSRIIALGTNIIVVAIATIVKIIAIATNFLQGLSTLQPLHLKQIPLSSKIPSLVALLRRPPRNHMISESFDLSEFLPYRIAHLSERVSRRLSLEYARSHGLSMAEWRVLVHLARCKEASVREIHHYANLDKPRVSRTVVKLEASGLVRKVTDQEDNRLVAISLTSKGQSVLNEILPDALKFEARLLNALSKDELRQFCQLMEKLHHVLDADPLVPQRSGMDANNAFAS